MISASTIIQIIDLVPVNVSWIIVLLTSIDHNVILDIHYKPTLSISSEEYEADSVTVTEEWASVQQADVRISPLVPIKFTGLTSLQLTILYNTEYNFSVVAVAPCRPNATAFITLNYGEVTEVCNYAYYITMLCIANCGNPNLLPMCKPIGNDSVPNIEGYDDIIPIEGTTISFSCAPGLVLIGPNSATCTENGEWEPDPRQPICTGYRFLHDTARMIFTQ